MIWLLWACAAPPGDDKGAGGDTATEAAPDGMRLVAPAAGTLWFVGTRYDVLATGVPATATVEVAGAAVSCAAVEAGVLHCAVVPAQEGPLAVVLSAGAETLTQPVTARVARGVVPDGDRFAMGMYEVMDPTWVEAVGESSVNLIQSYGTEGYTQDEWQDWAAAADLQTMTRTSWSWSDPWGAPSSDATLARLAGRPELAWWELPDNVVEDDSYAEVVAALVGRIRAVDDRPTFMYLWTTITPEQIEAYVPSLSVISPGTYPEHACMPQPWIRWRIESARAAVAAAGYAEEARPVVGTADLYSIPEVGCPSLQSTLPQVRMNPLAMMAAGARGVLYFAWYYAALSLDPAWGALALDTATLIEGEAGLGLAVVHGEARGALAVTVTDGPEWAETFTPLHEAASVTYPSIHAAAWDEAGTRFVIAVNYTDADVGAVLEGFPSQTPGVEVVGEGRTLGSIDGQVQDRFSPYGAHVYRAPILAD